MEIVIIINETTTLFSIVTLLSWCLLLAIIYYVHESIEIYSECICLKGLNFHFFCKILSKSIGDKSQFLVSVKQSKKKQDYYIYVGTWNWEFSQLLFVQKSLKSDIVIGTKEEPLS